MNIFAAGKLYKNVYFYVLLPFLTHFTSPPLVLLFILRVFKNILLTMAHISEHLVHGAVGH